MIYSNNCDSMSERYEGMAASGTYTLNPKFVNNKYGKPVAAQPGTDVALTSVPRFETIRGLEFSRAA